jgi:hypothetical protein
LRARAQGRAWRETILLSIFLTAGAVAIFVYGLELPYRLFWWGP